MAHITWTQYTCHCLLVGTVCRSDSYLQHRYSYWRFSIFISIKHNIQLKGINMITLCFAGQWIFEICWSSIHGTHKIKPLPSVFKKLEACIKMTIELSSVILKLWKCEGLLGLQGVWTGFSIKHDVELSCMNTITLFIIPQIGMLQSMQHYCMVS